MCVFLGEFISVEGYVNEEQRSSTSEFFAQHSSEKKFS